MCGNRIRPYNFIIELTLNQGQRESGIPFDLEIYITCPAVIYEHDIIDRQIRNPPDDTNFSFVGQDQAFGDMIIRSREKIVESTVDCIVFSRLDLYGKNAHRVEVIDKEIHLTFVTIVEIEQSATMSF